jgi:hypothetical protein
MEEGVRKQKVSYPSWKVVIVLNFQHQDTKIMQVCEAKIDAKGDGYTKPLKIGMRFNI